MPADEDYGPTNTTRRQLLLQHHAAASVVATNSVAPSSSSTSSHQVTGGHQMVSQSQPVAAVTSVQTGTGTVTVPDSRYHSTVAVSCPAGCSVAPDRLQATSQERLSERGSISSGSDRLHPCYQNTTSTERLERFATSSGQEQRFPASSTEKVEHQHQQQQQQQQIERLHERFPSATVERYQTPSTNTTTNTSSDHRHPTTERLQTSGHCEQQQRYRYPDRYTPVQQNIGSLDRYGSLASTTSSTADRYHTTDERSASSDRSLERYAPVDRLDRHSSAERFSNPDVYQQRVAQNGPNFERYNRYHQERYQPSAEYQQERFNCERYPPIPCPERFATQGAERSFSSQERITYSQVPYIPPPSPAPASDRFIPPPPLSPTNTPSPDCYPSNPFPSPTTVAPTERFIPPPPLSPSPTEKFSPKPDRFTDKRYPDRYSVSPNPDKYQNQDRYGQYHTPEPRYPERYPCYATTERYPQAQYHHQQERYSTNERHLPPTAHTPVERYVPQPQEPYYHQNYQTYERYPKWNQNNSGDPYMRRDLGYHHHYRLPVPFQQNHYQRMRYSHLGTPSRAKCCGQYQDAYQLSKSSPGSSSSSSSVTSQGKEIQSYVQPKDLQCYHQSDMFHQQQPDNKTMLQCGSYSGKDLQCVGGGYVSPGVRKVPACKHVCSSPSVEYVGQSGGRHISATPPPPRSASVGGESHCGDQCCLRRPQVTTLHTATIWRASAAGGHHPTPTAPPATNPSPSPTNQVNQQQQQQQQQQQPDPSNNQESPPPAYELVVPSPFPKPAPIPVIQRAISLPAAPVTAVTATTLPDRYHNNHNHQQQQQQQQQQEQQQPTPPRRIDYTQSERIPNSRERPKFARSASRKEAVKNFIKKETANFFGVDEETEIDQQLRWLDRRKRLASRTYGPLKDEFQAPSVRTLRRPATVAYASPAGSSRDDASLGEAHPPALYAGDRPDVLPAPSDVPDAPEIRYPDATVRRKESVARMTWDGISYVVNTLTKHRPRPRSQTRQWSRSYPPEEIPPSETLEDDVFFERPTTPASPTVPTEQQPTVTIPPDSPDAPLDPRPPPVRYSSRSGAPAWRRDTLTARRDQARPEIGGSRIWSAMLDSVLDNSDRRQYGMGWVGKMFGRSMRSSVARDEKVKQQLDDLEDYRPLFTYWVTTVQVLVLAISLVCYGFGPFGVDLHQRSGQVLVTSLSLQQVEYMEPANFWFGPRAADLIHLGAKFAPCMRIDNKIIKQIDKTREKERETACCIRNDDSGCVQSSQADCSKTISTWKKWSAGDSGPGGRISGSVCGLDPKFCDAPASVHPYEWPDDITKWPICRKTNSFTQRRGAGSGGTSVGTSARDKLAEHMVCEVIGHPCCIGIHGQCRITTREYCDFVRGHFHEEASLCSQVSCLDDVCGMVPFYFTETPDQFYRLWTSLFLHAGVLQLVVTVLIQHYLMRDLEKLTGPFRIGIIYIGSGVAGNLASSIFVPYRADVGPSGSQFGLLACLIVEVLNSWPMLKHPHHALFKLLSITFVLLLFGLLPWVDNYSHIFGFVFGFLLSYAFLPFVSFGPYDRQRKIVLIWVCLTSAGVLFICLVLLFYIIPVYDCEICSYFNCIPLTRDFCASQNINFMREEPVV